MKASLVVSRYSGSFLAIIWAVDGESIGSVGGWWVVVLVSVIICFLFVFSFVFFCNFCLLFFLIRAWRYASGGYIWISIEGNDYCLITLPKKKQCSYR